MSLAFILILIFFIGFVGGLRSMTAPAVVCWGAHFGWLPLTGSSVNFLAHPAALVIFTILAAGELIADKLPFIPSRTTPVPLIIRIILGATCGTALCVVAKLALGYGVLLGSLGAIVGAYGGYNYRRLIPNSGAAQFLTALLEDIVAVGGGFWIVSRF
jgi:uncharacterized membrane protein